MGIKSTLDSIDELPEEIKGFYVQDGERFVLDVEDIDSHPKVSGVITANKANRATRDKLRAELDGIKSRFDGLPEDFDVDSYTSLKEAAEGKGGELSEEKLNDMREKMRASIEKKYQPEIAARDEKLSKLDKALRGRIVDDDLSKALDAANIDAKHKSAVSALIKATAKIAVDEDGDSFKASVDTDMGLVGFNDFVKDWAGSETGKIYVAKSEGPNPNGSSKNGGGKTIQRAQFDAMTPPAKAEAMKNGMTITD